MGIGGISVWQLLIILAIVIMLFGTKRLRTLGSDLGSAVKGFRSSMSDENVTQADDGTAQDDSTDKRCIRAAQAVGGDAEWTYFNRVEIEMDTGVGNSDDTDPQIMLQYSDDEGNTWSAEKWRSMGAIGEYGKRIGWNRLGGTRKSRIFRVIISSPVKRNITRAWVS